VFHYVRKVAGLERLTQTFGAVMRGKKGGYIMQSLSNHTSRQTVFTWIKLNYGNGSITDLTGSHFFSSLVAKFAFLLSHPHNYPHWTVILNKPLQDQVLYGILNNRLLNNLYESKEISKGCCNSLKLAPISNCVSSYRTYPYEEGQTLQLLASMWPPHFVQPARASRC
jgi:hypothetical protein